MGDTFFKTRLANARTRFFRRSSAISEPPSSPPDNNRSSSQLRSLKPRHKTSFPDLPADNLRSMSTAVPGPVQALPPLPKGFGGSAAVTNNSLHDRRESVTTPDHPVSSQPRSSVAPLLTVQEPSSILTPSFPAAVKATEPASPQFSHPRPRQARPVPTPLSRSVSSNHRSSIARTISSRSPTETTPNPSTHTEYDKSESAKDGKAGDYFSLRTVEAPEPIMARRRIWIRRPGASATQVQVAGDDLVDDLRDMIIRKYANALGRSFDAPDLTLRIIPREHGQGGAERILGPEEHICRTVDGFFPGGQTVEEALLIEVPARRTPRPSPGLARPVYFQEDSHHPLDDGAAGYFPPMPLAIPQNGHNVATTDPRVVFHTSSHPHSMAIIETGQVPALPSPRAKGPHRPRVARQRTASPTVLSGSPGAGALPQGTSRHHRRLESGSEFKLSGQPPHPPPLPSPPPPDLPPATAAALASKVSTPPLDRVSSPRMTKPKKRAKNPTNPLQPPVPHPLLPPGLLDGSVPPINVLIVEDNIINLKLLEAFVKRLKVRWATAMNGRDAVTKWRSGGFHLVLMDIQLPIMSGLQATKEIRRLERVNGIGVFAKSEGEDRAPNALGLVGADGDGNGKLGLQQQRPLETDRLAVDNLFKSPVIIVALTASSLQSDRHEALAAGCNDFLTKPVNFLWFERKVMEWGCMQALIDFDGWRQWKNFGDESGTSNGGGGSGAGNAGDSGAEKEKGLSPAEREKREKKEARRAALLAKMGQG